MSAALLMSSSCSRYGPRRATLSSDPPCRPSAPCPYGPPLSASITLPSLRGVVLPVRLDVDTCRNTRRLHNLSGRAAGSATNCRPRQSGGALRSTSPLDTDVRVCFYSRGDIGECRSLTCIPTHAFPSLASFRFWTEAGYPSAQRPDR